LWRICSTHGLTTARWTPYSLIACHQYMIIAMQRLDNTSRYALWTMEATSY
jgi:hypothetical protein